MKVCFLLQDLALSGGVGVVVEHAHRLSRDHGFEVALAVLDGDAGRWDYTRLDGVRVATLDDVRRERFDVAIATWWRTAYQLFELDADRYAYFVQSMEDRFYCDSEVDRLQAAVTHDLPVAFITEARWIADLLAQFRPDAPRFYVRNGVAKETFACDGEVEPRTRGPLKVLIEGHPDFWLKGVAEAVEVTHRMTEPREVTLVTPGASAARELVADRVVGPLTPREMATAYGEADVVLKLSRVEGMFGPPLEGFHMGATCVVHPVTGHEEYVVHGWNGIVSNWDDLDGTARWLDVLARDRRLLHYLRFNARKTAQGWPSWHQSSQFMAAALKAIRQAPPPSPTVGASRMLGDVLAASERLRNEAIMLEHLVHAAHHEGVQRAASVTQSRAYRYGVILREQVWKHPLVRILSAPLRAILAARRSGSR